MANDQKGLEIKVGLFVLIGLVIIAAMAVQFGRVGQGLTDYYTITVNFPNASGLVKNADVQLSGARIGVVAESPKAIPGQIGVIPVQLKIRADIRLPKGCFFMIGKSGLMGDTSVMVALPAGFDSETFDSTNEKNLIPKKNAVLKGTPVTDFNELASQGEKNMRKLGETLDKIQNGVLSDQSVANLQASFANIKTSSENIAQASTKIGPVITSAESAVNTAKDTFAEAKAAMLTINGAATDVRGVVSDLRGMVKTGQGILKQTESGRGAIPMLLRDPEVADNLKSLIYNIRHHGVLFYRDSKPAATATIPSPTSTSTSRKHR